jgi:multiple antibiotic resistance protein
MRPDFSLFTETFTTLVAIINPFEVLPVYLKLLAGQDAAAHRAVARRACLYVLLLCFFFLIFGTLILRFFGVPLAMVRIAGGIILARIGLSLFMPQPSGAAGSAPGEDGGPADIAFFPLAMPLMFGPGVIATVIGMATMVKKHTSMEFDLFAAIAAAIILAVFVIYLFLVNARRLTNLLGATGIDAVSRIIGFFIAAMGVGLVFAGFSEALNLPGALQSNG